ncbi:MAG: hypothetical protein M1383_05895 [Patescibacteria group bacterium]|nr:hypothetical protein [Patescibacteria group bacterium]
MLENQRDYNHLLVTQAAGQTRKKRVKWAVIAIAVAAFVIVLLILSLANRA